MDLLLLVCLAVFIFMRLWHVLGQKPPHKLHRRMVLLQDRDIEIKKHKPNVNIFYPGFDESEFLEGAETAFMMILKAHQKNDQKSLKKLVSPSLLRTTFKSAPEDIPTKMGLTTVSVTSKHLEKTWAFVVVHFCSDQLFGDQTFSTEDTWTFKRDIKNNDPNWILDKVSSK